MSAPYSDNLYSVDYSDDDDSIAQQLSPADGFHASSQSSSSHPSLSHSPPLPHPDGASPSPSSPTSANVPRVPNILVPDPSLDAETSKATEARAETLNNAVVAESSPSPVGSPAPTSPRAAQTPVASPIPGSQPAHSRTISAVSAGSGPYTPPSTIVSPSSPHSRSLFGERTQLFQFPSDAPPAYTPSPISPSTDSQPQSFARTYQTFGRSMGNPEEERSWLLGGRPPQSMRDDPNDPEDPQPAWLVRRRLPARAKLKKILGVALILWIVLGFVWVIVDAIDTFRRHQSTHPPGSDEADLFKPTPGGDVGWSPHEQCVAGEHRKPHALFSVDFDSDRSLTLLQTIDSGRCYGECPSSPHHRSPSVWGDVVLHALAHDGDKPGIDLEIVTNDDDIDVQVTWDKERQELNVTTPQWLEWDRMLSPCIQIRMMVRAPQGATLDRLTVAAVALGIQLENPFDLTADESTFQSVAGQFVAKLAHKHEARKISVQTVSRNIRGTLPLLDSLAVHSLSGNVDIDVIPHSSSGSARAYLSVETVSGHVAVREPLDKLPARDYTTNLGSTSGDVRGSVAFTSSGKFSSYSGDVEVDVLPVLDKSIAEMRDGDGGGDSAAYLATDSTSGNVRVKVRDAKWVEMDNLRAVPKPPPYALLPVDGPYPHLPLLSDPDVVHDIDDFLRGPPSLPGSPPPVDIYVPPLPPPSSAVSLSAGGDRTLGCLVSHHNTISGDLHIRMPETWEGKFAGTSVSGRITVHGPDVHFDGTGDIRAFWKSVKGYKGRGDSQMKFGSVSGDIRIVLGEDK